MLMERFARGDNFPDDGRACCSVPFEQREHFVETGRRNREKQTAARLRIAKQKPLRPACFSPIDGFACQVEIVARSARNAVPADPI